MAKDDQDRKPAAEDDLSDEDHVSEELRSSAPTSQPTPGPSPDVGGAPTRPPEADPAQSLYRDIFNQLGETQRRSESILEEQQQTLAPTRQELLRSAREPVPGVPPLQPIRRPPDYRRLQELTGMGQLWLGAAVGIAALGSRRSQTPAITGLTALGSLLDGVREGNTEKVKQAYDAWQKANDAIVETNKQLTDRYNLILKNKKMTFDQKVQELQLTASMYHDMMALQALKEKNLVDMGKLVSSAERNTATIEKVKRDIELYRLRMQTEQLRQQNLQGGGLSPERDAAARLAAERGMLHGDWGGLTGRMRDRAYVNRVDEYSAIVAKEHNLNAATVAARSAERQSVLSGERRMGAIQAVFIQARTEARELLPSLYDAITRVESSRTEWQPLNEIIRRVNTKQGSQDEVTLVSHLNGAANAFSRALVPVHGTKWDRENLLAEVIAQGQTPGQMRAVLRSWDVQLEATARAFPKAYEELRGGLPGYGGGAEKAQARAALTVEQQRHLARAREVLAGGASRQRVEEKLREKGIDPALLD